MKLLKTMSKLIVQTCFIVLLCTVTTVAAMQWYVGELLRQLNMPAAFKPVGPADLLGKWGEQLAALTTRTPSGKTGPATRLAEERADRETPHYGALTESGSLQQPHGKAGDEKASPLRPDTEKPAPDDAVAVWSQVSGTGANGQKSEDAYEQNKRVVITSEDVAKKKDAISGEDKMKLFSMLVGRLPQSEMQNISKIAEDGLTQTEIKELERIVTSYLEPKEYAELMQILNKY